jgi:NAD(P)-dependent dehydrogenase (short-subunit alcohol dehydrogenase family)
VSDELAGKVAIVTGGAGGLGSATVRRFVEEGARVVIADVDIEDGEALAAELGASVAFQATDVSDAMQVQAAVDGAVERFGRLDVMVNNAGISGSRRRFLDDDLTDFDKVIAVNLYGVMVGTQRAARHMAADGGGSRTSSFVLTGQPSGERGQNVETAATKVKCYFSPRIGAIPRWRDQRAGWTT